jgi:uncharacterized protein (TIGR02246 family)
MVMSTYSNINVEDCTIITQTYRFRNAIAFHSMNRSLQIELATIWETTVMRTIAKTRQTGRDQLRWSAVVGLVCASMLGAAPAGAATTAECAQPSRNGIANLFDRWNAALASSNVSQLVDLYGDEAVLVAQPGDKPYSGKLAISDYYKDLLHRHPQASVISRTIDYGCNYATDSGIVVYRITGTRKGTRMLLGGRYITQYRLENGSWRIVRHHLGAVPRSAGEMVVGQN